MQKQPSQRFLHVFHLERFLHVFRARFLYVFHPCGLHMFLTLSSRFLYVFFTFSWQKAAQPASEPAPAAPSSTAFLEASCVHLYAKICIYAHGVMAASTSTFSLRVLHAFFYVFMGFSSFLLPSPSDVFFAFCMGA